MWVFILIGILIGVIVVIYQKSKKNMIIKQESGMLQKYTTLINRIKNQSVHMEISDVSTHSTKLTYSTSDDLTTFIIQEKETTLEVEWNLKSNTLGDHHLDWSFPKSKNQDEIADTILKEIVKYEEGKLGTGNN